MCLYFHMIHMHIYIYIYTHCISHRCAPARTHIYTYIYIYIYTYDMHMFTYMCIYIYIYVYICMCVFILVYNLYVIERWCCGKLHEAFRGCSPRSCRWEPQEGRAFWCFFGGVPAARYLVKPNYQNNKVFCWNLPAPRDWGIDFSLA